MTLPASPPITLAQVCAEFGAPSNTPLGAFLRGGAWVPNTPTNSGVPTSLPISLGQLCGASATTPLSASALPASLTKLGTGTVTTGTTTCTATGGSGTKTYSWTRVSGDTQIICNSPSSATTAFHAAVGTTGNYSAVWKCTVTDSSGSASSNDVSVNITSLA